MLCLPLIIRYSAPETFKIAAFSPIYCALQE